MNANANLQSVPYNALRGDYGQSATNFVWSVAARQLAFALQSQGFIQKKQTADTQGAPKSDEAPSFDAALSIGIPTVDMVQTTVTFDRDRACEVYAIACVMVSDLLTRDLEYGRKPKPESLSRYLSSPAQWMQEKIQYHTPRISKDAREQGATFGATAEAITANVNAKVEEYRAFAHRCAADMANAIKSTAARLQSTDWPELVEMLEEGCADLKVSLHDEVIGAAKALIRIRREAYECGEKVTMPQPGVLKLFADLGVTA